MSKNNNSQISELESVADIADIASVFIGEVLTLILYKNNLDNLVGWRAFHAIQDDSLIAFTSQKQLIFPTISIEKSAERRHNVAILQQRGAVLLYIFVRQSGGAWSLGGCGLV